MSWDSSKATTGRRRGNSTLTAQSKQQQQQQQQKPSKPIEPKSAHVADPFLQSFLAPTFDAAEYLNATLPPLQLQPPSQKPPPPIHNSSAGAAVPLAELSAQAQAQTSQLGAHTARLAATLTQLTDDILRSGSRLAYEVELLRGETLGLSEALRDGLRDDVARFVPDGIPTPGAGAHHHSHGVKVGPGRTRASTVTSSAAAPTDSKNNNPPESAPTATDDTAAAAATDPPYITQLRTLTLVRSRLDAVVKTFGDAMEFVFPPSELSVSSSFLSVSAPEPGGPGGGDGAHSTEEKGQQVLRRLRDEIADLLRETRRGAGAGGVGGGVGGGAGAQDPLDGIEKAARRIEELKELAVVWRGTAEEKGRAKFIDGLAKSVEDRHKELLREMEQQQQQQQQGGRRDARGDGANGGGGGSGSGSSSNSGSRKPVGGSDAAAAAAAEAKAPTGYGLISQWQRLRTGL